MLISQAFAQTAVPAAGGGFMSQIIALGLIFAVFYFLLIRPQQKRMKRHQEMLQALKKGDEVITAGGIYAKVTKVASDEQVEVEISDKVKVTLAKSTIADVVTNAAANAGSSDKKKAA